MKDGYKEWADQLWLDRDKLADAYRQILKPPPKDITAQVNEINKPKEIEWIKY